MVQSENRLRFACVPQVQSGNRLRFSTDTVQTWGNRLRFASQREVQSANLLRYRSMTEAYDQVWRRGRATSPNSLPQVSILADGVELCPAPFALQVTLAESAATQWEVRIKDPFATYHPKNPNSPFFGKLKKGTSMVARVTWEGAEFVLVGVGTGCGHRRSWQDHGQLDFVWKGIDLSKALFRTGFTTDTLRSSANSGVFTTKTAAETLLSQLGVAHNLGLMEATAIRMQNRQDGRPGDWFQKLLDVLWHKWIFRGRTLCVYKPNYFGAPQWHYGAGHARILDDDWQVDEPNFCNSVTARIARESNAGLPPKEHTTFGRFSEKFNPPIEGFYWRILADTGGRFSDFYLKNNGATIAVRENRGTVDAGLTQSLANTVDEVVYTFGSPGGFATGGYGKIQFRGAAQDKEEAMWGPPDQPRSLTRVNLSSLGAGDDKNHQELSPNSLMASFDILKRHADGFLLEQAAQADPQAFGVPLNLLLYPGELVQIHDDRIGTEEIRYVRKHTLTIGTSLELCGSRLDTVYVDPSLQIGDEDE